jgi:hypothetical protein
MASHLISAAAQVRSLAKAVSAAFAASALTDEERNPDRIEIPDLPWTAPPLRCSATLGGVPLSDYLNVPMALDETLLHRFWVKTLDDLWHRPSSAIRRGAFANCAQGMPKLKVGQRAFLFSTPAGFPAQLDSSAGAMLSIEVAHAAAQSLPILDVVSDEDNYYVVMPDERIIGVRAGKPACDSPWGDRVSGMVQEMLEMSRGEPDYTLRFDQLAAMRSVVNVHRRRFPEFQGLDWGLQALRILTLGGHCPELMTQMRMTSMELPQLRRNEQILRDCLAIVDDLSLSDRSKLQIWQNYLVPEVISVSRFKQVIYGGAQWPFSLPLAKLESIRTWLEERYRALPANIQKEGVCRPIATP